MGNNYCFLFGLGVIDKLPLTFQPFSLSCKSENGCSVISKETLSDVNQNNGFLFALTEHTVINNSLFFDYSKEICPQPHQHASRLFQIWKLHLRQT